MVIRENQIVEWCVISVHTIGMPAASAKTVKVECYDPNKYGQASCTTHKFGFSFLYNGSISLFTSKDITWYSIGDYFA